MRIRERSALSILLLVSASALAAQTPAGRGNAARPRPIQIMTLAPSDWKDGAMLPERHAQRGRDVSPALTWSGGPSGASSYVLLVHDIDAPSAGGADDALHWLVWNIPGSATGIQEGVTAGGQRPDGSRQISMSGPYYRGPAAPATGPIHHYVFEVFALDTLVNVPAVGASPADTRAAVRAAMTGHIRGKGSLVALYRRNP